MRTAYIVSPVRTAVGKYLGALADVPAERLAETVIRALVGRSGIDPAAIDDVILAQSYANGEAPSIGRWAALAADLPMEVPGMQLDRRCAGGLTAVATAAAMVQGGMADVIIAGGAESMSNVEYYTNGMRKGMRAGNAMLYDRLDRQRERSQPVERFGVISGMIETAENVAREHEITRADADAYAVRSHQRAAAAWDAGKFVDELVPVTVMTRKGEVIVDRDEGIRAETTTETMATLRPLMKDGIVTAGNASQQNDAAAACLVVSEEKLKDLGLTPMARFVGYAVAGCHPGMMGIGPVPAVAKLLRQTSLGWNDIDLVELNEAFAPQVLACLKGWDWNDADRLNVNGGGISLGHPIAATGARILASMLHEMQRRGARYGLETMCVGGGQGAAAIFERA
ncbi:acetyl-CoA C-acetyltransferase [Sphingobium yanoikuyae]|uniref:Acetyl-CoA C-acyltransferase n=1 Tax=Sphingobium yanoikuyae TaxID=13690 RepID=A0A291N0H3_SPHYA|nr:acetyl-CoA C-acetyltransferase [Sphingobium yanoikuyae]ATI80668.1 acetyl-CoA C-acyltransferase [Sphingobium yanoikuyae]